MIDLRWVEVKNLQHDLGMIKAYLLEPHFEEIPQMLAWIDSALTRSKTLENLLKSEEAGD